MFKFVVDGLNSLLGWFQKWKRKGEKPADYIVGYSAPYALKIHEDLNISHPIHGDRDCHGQAKFLETAARKMKKFLAARMARLLKQGLTLQEANLVMAHELLEASNLITPEKTGNLRASGSVKLDKNANFNLSAMLQR